MFSHAMGKEGTVLWMMAKWPFRCPMGKGGIYGKEGVVKEPGVPNVEMFEGPKWLILKVRCHEEVGK